MPSSNTFDPRKKSVRRVVDSVVGEPWAITESKLQVIAEFLEDRANGGLVSDEEIRSQFGAAESSEEKPQIVDGVQVIDVDGTLAPRMNLMMRFSGGTSTEMLERKIHEAGQNDKVKTILLRIDSPGGAASYTPEVARAIRESPKRTVAVAQNTMASGAYWIGSAADEVYASESTQVGSIGVYMVLSNQKERFEKEGVKFKVFRAGALKAAGNPYEEWSGEQVSSLQKQVDDIYETFTASVAESRGVTQAEVKERFGKGSVFLAAEAAERGMIDGVATFAEVLDRERKKLTGRIPESTVSIHHSEETMTFSAKLKSALHAADLVASAEVSDETVEVAIKSWCKAKSLSYDELKSKEDALIKSLFDIYIGDDKPTQQASDKPKQVNESELRDKVLSEERFRQNEMRARAKLIPHVTAEQVEAAIDSGISVERAVESWLKNASTLEQNVSVTAGAAQVDKYVEGATEAILARCGSTFQVDDNVLANYGNAFRYKSFLDIARGYMQQCGHQLSASGNPEDDARAFLAIGGIEQRTIQSASSVNRSAQHPHLLDWLAGKMLKRPYPIADVLYEQWAARLPDVNDFDPKHFVEVGIFDELDLLQEDEDPASVKFSSGLDSWYKVDRFANETGLTVEMVVGDKVQGFARQLASFSRAPARTINSRCIALLQENPTLLDGTAMFHTSRGNIVSAGSGGAPSDAQASVMREKHRLIPGYANQVQGVPPKMALCPAHWEGAAKQTFMIGVRDPKVANTDSTINTVRGEISPLIDARLDAFSNLKWWTAIDPNESPCIGYAYFNGYGQGGQRRSYVNPKTLTRYYVIEARFGVAAVGWRGMVQNAGQ